MNIEDFMKAVQYRITGGEPYCWTSFGPDARYLNADDDDYGSGTVYDSRTQVIYAAEVHDHVLENSYRWINPAYAEAHDREAKERGVDISQAWDHVRFTNLDSEQDFLTKCRAIVAGESYDTRVSVPIELEDDELFQLMKLAHERDVTLNQLVERILTEVIQKHSVAV